MLDDWLIREVSISTQIFTYLNNFTEFKITAFKIISILHWISRLLSVLGYSSRGSNDNAL